MIYNFIATLTFVIAIVALLPVAGLVYRWIGSGLDRRSMLAPGNLVRIGAGRELYVIEKGHGGPTVVFESGFAATSLNWHRIQAGVAEHVHTVSYDRFGLGWSSAAKSTRTPANIVEELRSMLRETGIEPPFVLVGHSFGGLVMRRYALDYPEEILGAVLVDPMRTEEWPPVNPMEGATLERAKRLTGYAVRFAQFGVARLAARSLLCGSGKLSGGLARRAGGEGSYLIDRLTDEVGKLPEELHASIASHWSEPNFYRGLMAYLDAVPETVREMHDAESIRDRPVVVLTPGSAVPLSAEDMRNIAANARQIIAEHSKHWVHLDEPQLVIDTIVQMVHLNCSALQKEDDAYVIR